MKQNIQSSLLIATLIVVVSGVNKIQAQTEPMYGQYMYNMISINPAYAGNRNVMALNTFYRNQWSGISGAPKTTSVGLDGPLDQKGLGFGVQLYNDVIGVENATGLNAMISKGVKLSENSVLSVGLSAGLMNYRADLTQVPNLFTPNDPAFYQNYNSWLPTVGAGIFYNTDHFYMGVSIPNVLLSRISTLDMIKSNIEKIDDYHFFVTSGVVIDASENVKIKPSVLMKMISGAPIEFDLNTNVWLKDIVGLGVSYRTGDAVIGMLELQATKQLRIGTAYEIPISSISGYTSGTYELLLRYEFGKDLNKIKSTRYF